VARSLLILGALAAVTALLTGCQVHTQIAINEAAGGSGTVAVTVTLDASAVAAVGGRPALAAQLKDADLVAAGWAVAGPNPGPGSTTVISASHPFDTTAQAGALVGELAGTGPDSSRPFRLSISEHHSYWRTDTTLTGKVDLTCGLACFGDSGLSTSLGSPVGVNAGPLASAAHQSPDQVFTFSVAARLDGKVLDTDGVADTDGTLHWTPRLGQSLEMSAVTRSWNEGRIKMFVIAGGVLVVLVIVLLGVILYRWRRRRRRRRARGKGGVHGAGRSRGGRHRKTSGKVPDTVAPRS
jgi:hypothetical protein